jgi:ABC-2 type transport system permease protein
MTSRRLRRAVGPTLTLVLWQIRYEQRAFWRDRRRAIFSFMFPIMMLLLFGSLNRHSTVDDGRTVPFLTFFVPGIIAYGVVTTTFSNLAVSLAAAREQGLLKRIKGTPLPWWAFFGGRAGGAICVTAAMTVSTLVLAHVLFGVPVRASTLPAFATGVVVGSAAFTALGVGVVRWLPSADTAGPMQAAIVFPLAFISGVWFPMHDAPSWLNHVSLMLPLRPLADALQTAFDPHTTGSGFAGGDLLSLALWTVAGGWLMIRFLRSAAARN